MLRTRRLAFLILSALLLSSCGTSQGQTSNDGLQVVATTTIAADVVQQVAGASVEVTTLLPLGADPHSFQPSPQDAASIARADLVFINGANLEIFLEPLLESAGGDARVVDLSQEITLLHGTAHAHEIEEEEGDPHVWWDPNNVIAWTRLVERELSAADPERAGEYTRNADAYAQELQALDLWVDETFAQVPSMSRLLVSDHVSLTYFAERYGFREVGAIIPGYSTLAEASADDIASLQKTIRENNVQAIFVGPEGGSALANQIARDTGVKLVPLYTGSLSEAGGPAPTYLEYMRYNISQIVDAFSQEAS